MKTTQIFLACLAVTILLAGCQIDEGGDRFCYGDGVCVEPDGNIVDVDGGTVCEITGTCGDEPGGDRSPGDGDVGPGDGPVVIGCDCTAGQVTGDSDGDCIEDSLETANNNSDPTMLDTDGDGINDGCEDTDRDGIGPAGGDDLEMDPRNTDSDGDGLPDGVEDSNQNGRYDFGETHGARPDTDFDGIPDGAEDANGNGQVDPWVDVDGDGCFGVGDTAGETNPRGLDSDNDGIPDDGEDQNLNGVCDAGETCAWLRDSDCDMLDDGVFCSTSRGVVGGAPAGAERAQVSKSL